MKNKKVSVLIYCSTLLLPSLFISGCKKAGNSTENQLTKLTLTPPEKKLYHIGESLDLSGMVLQASFEDGSKKVLTKEEYSVSDFSTETGGKKTIKVSYQGMSRSFKIVVCHDEYKAINGSAEYTIDLNRKTNKADVKLSIGSDIASITSVDYTLSDLNMDENFEVTEKVALAIGKDAEAKVFSNGNDISYMYGGKENIINCFATEFVLDVDSGSAEASSEKEIYKYKSENLTIIQTGDAAYITENQTTTKAESFIRKDDVLQIDGKDYLISSKGADGIIQIIPVDQMEHFAAIDSVLNGKEIQLEITVLTDKVLRIRVDAAKAGLGNIFLYSEYQEKYGILTLKGNIPELEHSQYANAIYSMIEKKTFYHQNESLKEIESYTLKINSSGYDLNLDFYDVGNNKMILFVSSDFIKPMIVNYQYDESSRELQFTEAEKIEENTELTSGQQQFFRSLSSRKYILTENNVIVQQAIYTATISNMNVTFTVKDLDTVSVKVASFDSFDMTYHRADDKISFSKKGDYQGAASQIAEKLVGTYLIGENNVLTLDTSEDTGKTDENIKGTLKQDSGSYKGSVVIRDDIDPVDVWVNVSQFEESGTCVITAGGGTMTCSYTKKDNQVTFTGGEDATGNLAYFKNKILGTWNII